MDFSYETSDGPQFLFQTTVFLNVPFLKWYILKHDVFFYDVASEGESKWTVINKVFAWRLLKVPRLEPLLLLGYTSLIKMYPFGIPLVENGTPSFLTQIMDHFLLKKKKKKKKNGSESDLSRT